MKLNKSKGIGISMVFFAIAMTSLLAAAAAYAQVFKLPPAFGETVNDAGVVAEPEARLDDTVNHYLPMAGRYAVLDGAYNVSKENAIYTGVSDGDADEMEVFKDLIIEAEVQSQDFYKSYLDTQYFRYCEVDLDKNSVVNVSYSTSKVNITSRKGNHLVKVDCSNPDTEIKTKTPPNKQLQFNTSRLRFQELASIVTQTLIEMEQVSESLEDNGRLSGTATGDNCGSASAAETEAENEIDDQFNSIEAAIVESGHGFGGPDRGAMHRLDEATSTSLFCVGGLCVPDPFHGAYNYDAYITDKNTWRESVSANDVGDCDCDTCGTPPSTYDCNCDTDYSVSQDYEYRSIEVQTNITDDKYTIPTKDGFTELFMNKKYERNFDIP